VDSKILLHYKMPTRSLAVHLKFVFSIIFLLLLIDIAAKAMVRAWLSPGDTIPLFSHLLRLHYVQNYTGFSWWVPVLPSWTHTAFSLLLLVICIAAVPIYMFYTQTRGRLFWVDLAFVTVVAACLGHLSDDLILSFTTDFIQIFNSPSANLADIYSYIGIGALIVAQIFGFKHRPSSVHDLRGFLHEALATRREFFKYVRNGLKR
jgi:lipoprotein signal peptidase